MSDERPDDHLNDTASAERTEPTGPKMIAQGKVVETRPTGLIIREPGSVEEHFYAVKEGHGVVPGWVVRIFDDGSVEVGGGPSEEKTIEVPSQPEPIE